MLQLIRPTQIALAVGLISVGTIGCGANLYESAPVRGTVMCNGKPAHGGYVIFEPIDDPDKTGRPKGSPGRISRGFVESDGSFTVVMDPRGSEVDMPGALVGPHRVRFVPPLTEPPKWDPADNWLPKEDQEKLKAELAATPVFEPLDCGPQGITPNQVEVVPGENSFEFTLQPGGTAPRRR